MQGCIQHSLAVCEALSLPAGHWKMRHIMYNLVLMQVTILSQLGLFVMIRTGIVAGHLNNV